MKLRNFFYVLLLLFFTNNLVTAQEWTKNLPQKAPSEITFFDYQKAFYQYCDKIGVEDGYYFDQYGEKHKMSGWKQFKRWEWFWEQRVDPQTGKFPNLSAEDMIHKYYNPPQGLPTGLAAANWTSLGPNSSGGGYAGVGRLNCIAFHPTDDNTYWVGAAAGGIWKTTDGGSTWSVLNNGTAVLGVSDIVIPSDYDVSHTMYIATGDRDHTDNRSVGVLKSTDDGVTWNATDLSFNLTDNDMVTRLLLDPNDNNTLIASTRSGVYKTTDGGQTWPMIDNPVFYFIDMEYKPGDFNTLYGATRYDGDVWRSIDGGDNWVRVLDTGGRRVELAVSPANSSVVYALVGAADNTLFGVYRSTDSGTSFALVYDGSQPNHNLLGYYTDKRNNGGGQAFYDLSLAVSNTDEDMLFVGGVNTFKSTDGGMTFDAVNCWTAYNVYNTIGAPVVHADKHRLEYRSNGDLYECNDGGVYISTDDGAAWTDRTNGMVISQMYRLGVSQTVATETQCGLQDNGTKLITGGVWSDVRGGDGMECIIDYTDVNIQYNTYVRGAIRRTDNHWTNSVGIQPAGSSGAWVTPYVIDPVDHNTIYAGYQHIYKSTNKGDNWNIIYNLNSAGRFRALAVAPSNTQYIYASEPYRLWKTTNGGTNWTDITNSLPGSFITYIAVKNDDPNTVWVTLSTYSGNSVYQTTDGGNNWVSMSTGLPSVPVNTIVQNKLVTDQVDLYAGTDNGVYYKAGAANWTAFNGGLPNVDVSELEIYYAANAENSKLRAASFGRGLWETPIIAPCSITITQSDEGTCNDNGTGTDASDDWFDITFNATAVSSVSTQYQVVLNANSDGTGGTVLGTSDYGTAITVGTSNNPPFVADGATTYNITIRDATNNLCHADYTTSPVASCSSAPATCTELFISEYIEGSGQNKCIEIYNPTNAPVDLAAGNYKLKRYSNGNTNGVNINLTGTIAAYDVYVICNPNAGATFLAQADDTNNKINHNGDDAYEFLKAGVVIDAFGRVGEDPGSAWTGGGCTTKNRTLVRKSTIQVGDSNSGDSFDPSIEWDCYPKDDDTHLGSHTSDCYVPAVCSLTIDQSDEGTCNDNGTATNANDDWFDITFNASSTNGGATDKYEVVLNANSDGTGGTVLNTGGTTYGTAVTVGDATTPPFVADGVTTYNITVRDIDDPTCHADYTTSPVNSCSTGTITIGNSGGTTISDPCTCAGDGLFDEEIVISSSTGENWVLASNTGYQDPGTGADFAVGTAFVETPAGSGSYSLVGQHVDDIGYSITATSTSHPGVVLSISNECWYPDPSITGLNASYCVDDPAVPLTGSAQLGDGSGAAPEESHDFSIDGVGGSTQFDPNALGVGVHQVIYTFDAVDDNPDEHHPGCVAFDTLDVTVNALPNVVAESNSPVCMGEDINLQETGGDAVSWSWTGPNGFTSTDQNPTITGATAAAAGTYTVVGTNAAGCEDEATVDVVINALPTVIAGSNSPICEGEDINLTETGGEADTWSWTGPNGFTSTDQNPTIAGATLAAAGTYTVVGTNSTTGCEDEATVDVVVNPKPDAPVVDDITVCEGGSTNIVPQQPGGGGTPTCGLSGDVSITGIMDGPLTGGTPKFVELYVYNTTDFTGWSLRNHNNGNTGVSNSTDLTPLGTVNAGEYVYVIRWGNMGANEQAFLDWFGLTQAQYNAMNTIAGPAPNVNGDDAVTLFDGTNIVDQYGVVGVDGTGQTWEYRDGWAYRNDETGPNGTGFNDTEWTYSGKDALDGETDNATAQTPFPIGTYVCTGGAGGTAVFNFYTDAGLTNLVAGAVASYDPGTTTTNSPQSIWVTQVNTTTGCESDAVEVVVTVYEQPEADAGDNQFFCDLPASVQLNATANYDGQWTTTGAGTFADATNTSTTYAPDAADLGTTVVLTWTTSSPNATGCEDAIDSIGVTFVPPTEDAEFSYTQDEYCPEDGNPTVTHTTGVDGIYTWVAVGPGNNLVIDEQTGEIDLDASEWGVYDVTNTVDGRGNLVITGIIDGDIPGGLPKAIELYAIKDISDLGKYGLERAANNNASTGTPSFVFPHDAVAAGTHIWISKETVEFKNFFGFDPTYTNNVANGNGDDAIILYNDGQVIDVFGEVGQNNNIADWNYKDGWAYRNNNTGPDGTLFTIDNWSFSGPNALDGETSNATAATPFPIETFSTTFTGSCDANTHTERVTVGDIEPPTVNCPADKNVYLDAGECSIFLWYDDPDVFDNCSGEDSIVVVSGPAKGSEFTLLGSPYTIEFEVYDANGNGPVNCSFDIAIHGYPKPLDGTLVCNDDVQISLDTSCNIQMNADNFLEGGPYQCYNMFEVYVDDPAFAGMNVSNENIHLDPGTYMVTVKDAANGGNNCMTTIHVFDKIVPEIECNCPEGGQFPEGSEWLGVLKGKFTGKDNTFNIHDNCYNFGTMEVLPDDGSHYYDIYAIEVSVDGDYNFSMSDDNGKAILGIYETYFNSAEVCSNLIWGDGGYFNFLGSFYVEPNNTVTLQAGKQYYLVVSDFDDLYKGKYTLEIVPPADGHVNFTQAVYSDKCTFAGCYNPKKDYVFEAPDVTDNCDVDVVLLSSDVVDMEGCGKQKFVNVWQATDLGGNTVTCTQEYILQGTDLGKIKWPVNYDDLPFNKPMLECDGSYPLDQYGNPSPYNKGGLEGTGKPSGFSNACGTVEIFYTDEVYTEDDGVVCGTKIIRTWTVVDDCTGAVLKHKQIIRITDKTAPEFMVNEDIVAKAKAYICNANVDMPTIMHLNDNCCATPKWWITTDMNFEIEGDINGNGYVDANETWTVMNVPLGNYTVCYHAVDCCGNEVTQCFNLRVEDQNPPVAACEQFKQVSLTAMGNARLYAYDLSSGSFDNCNPVHFKILRVNDDLEYDGGCQELNGDDKPSTPRYRDDNGNWKNNEVWYDDDVYYCCEDVGRDVMTSLRVFDTDPGAGAINPKRFLPGGDLYGHYNDCWAMVHVECKIPPALTCPDLEVTCEESLDPFENTRLMPEVISVCGLDTIYKSDKRDNGICGGKITRTWTAIGCGMPTSCRQKITITTTEEFDPCTITFPKDVKADCSEDLKEGKEPKWDENPCNVVTAEVIHEDTFRFVDNACYKIVREWAVIDWCVYEPNTGAEDNVDAISGRKLNCAQLVRDGYYRYTQVLMVTDFIPPTIHVTDACIGFTDGCVAEGATVTAYATDSCNVEQKFNWKYIVTNMDTWETVQYSYNYTPTPDTGVKGKRTKDNLDRTAVASLLIVNAIPEGHYRVTWIVGDGCGNANTAYQYFDVVDKKAPTPVMVNVATALMQNCMVEVCAKQFDKGGCDGSCISSFDNCTPKEELYFTFNEVLPKLEVNPNKWQKQYAKYGRYFFDPETGLISNEEKYMFGEAYAWDPVNRTACRVFGLDRDGNAPDLTNFLKIYVWDKFALNDDCDDNNFDYATVVLNINKGDEDDCPGFGSLVSGKVSTCSNDKAVSNVRVSYNDSENIKESLSNANGEYSIELGNHSYKVTATKTTAGIEGISTLDIVLIQKHLLGIRKIKDVCKYAAMDVTGDGKVTASDILKLRKKILGSVERKVEWNFIDDAYLEDHPTTSGFSLKNSYTKTVLVKDNKTQSNTDFVGIYAGDVNLSSSILENRSAENTIIEVDNIDLVEGTELEIPVYGKDFTELYGAQMAMSIGGLEIQELKPGLMNVGRANYNIADGQLVLSWSDAMGIENTGNNVLFTIVAKSKITGELLDVLSINDSELKSESYTGADLEIKRVKLDYRNVENIYRLYQNEPNPFSDKTIIGFELPHNSDYSLTVFDVTGKLIKKVSRKGKSGYNSVEMTKEELGASGVLYYQLEAGDFIGTKKMIILK